MTKITDIWNDPGSRCTLSFELSPPRNEKAAENLDGTIDELTALKPDFFSVTFGAGGSTREGSRSLVNKLKKEKGQEVIAYVAPFGMAPEEVSAVLGAYKELGVTDILAVRGDRPRDVEDFKPHPESFPYATRLISYINDKFDFNLGAAGYPEGHAECVSLDKDMEILKAKADSGAKFIISQYFYDNEYYFDFIRRAREAGIEVPIIAGVMPIYSVKMMNILAGVCGATITEDVKKGIAGLPEEDKEALQQWGVDFAVGQCKGLLEAGVPGLHFYTINRGASVKKIVHRLRDEGAMRTESG